MPCGAPNMSSIEQLLYRYMDRTSSSTGSPCLGSFGLDGKNATITKKNVGKVTAVVSTIYCGVTSGWLKKKL
jgi:hypothetical protein